MTADHKFDRVPQEIKSQSNPETKCPFVSENGPSCPQCGAPPTSVNLDPGGYGHCDNCGGKFRLKRRR